MLSKQEAMVQAKKLSPPKKGVVIRIKPIEVALAWMELHGLGSVKTRRGNPRWEGDLLVVRKGEKPVQVPLPSPPVAFATSPQMEESHLEGID